MRLVGCDGTEVGIRILGYEFPDAQDYDDANWLLVEVEGVCELGRWKTVFPCLEVRDAWFLVEWLRRIATGMSVEPEIGFIEPDLRFILLPAGDEGVTVRVYFELEVRPPWSPSGSAYEEDCWLNISTSREALIEASAALERELQAFPERGTNA